MSIESPQALLLLLLLIPVGLVFLAEIFHTRNALRQLGEHWSSEDAQSTVLFKWFLSVLCLSGFFLFSILALAGLHWGEQPVEQDRKDLDIIFVMDVSRSMLATDIKPSRLERAVEVVAGTLRELPELRASIIAYRGRPVTLIPLTEDHSALENALRYISPELSTAGGTNPDQAVAQALAAFPASSNRHRMVLLLADGEGLGGRAAALASKARQEGIPFICVGIGSPGGALVQLPNGASLTDGSGNPVLTRLEETNLKNLAILSGGLYFNASEGGIFKKLVDGIKGMQQRSEQEGFYLVPVDHHELFITLALICLALYVVVRSLRWRKTW